jgi:hypothetical protein
VRGGYRLDDGALVEDVSHFVQAIGVMELLAEAHGAAIPRAMVPAVPDVLLDGVQTLWGSERINARPHLLCSDAALMPLVGFNAPQGRHGVRQRGASQRQRERAPGPLGPDTLAQNSVPWNLRDLPFVVTGAMRALATAGGVGQPGTGRADGPDLETTAHYAGCGQGTRPVRRADKRSRVHAIDGTV